MTKQKQNLADLYRENPLQACRLALRRTANVRWQDRLEAINKLLEMHGTEAIRGEWPHQNDSELQMLCLELEENPELLEEN